MPPFLLRDRGPSEQFCSDFARSWTYFEIASLAPEGAANGE
jgi:hypothetical protein